MKKRTFLKTLLAPAFVGAIPTNLFEKVPTTRTGVDRDTCLFVGANRFIVSELSGPSLALGSQEVIVELIELTDKAKDKLREIKLGRVVRTREFTIEMKTAGV